MLLRSVRRKPTRLRRTHAELNFNHNLPPLKPIGINPPTNPGGVACFTLKAKGHKSNGHT